MKTVGRNYPALVVYDTVLVVYDPTLAGVEITPEFLVVGRTT